MSTVTPNAIVLVGGPVEARPAVEMVLAVGADHDVVAALADHLVEAAAADEHVVAGDRVRRRTGRSCRPARRPGCRSRSSRRPRCRCVGMLVLAPRMKSLPGPAKVSRDVLAGDDEVVAGAADDQVEAVAAVDDVVAVVALEDVVAADVGDDVVAGAAFDVVVAVAALEAVVAAVAPERVVAVAGDQDVVAVGAAEHDVLVAGVLRGSWCRRPAWPGCRGSPAAISCRRIGIGRVIRVRRCRPDRVASLNCRVWSTSRMKPGVENTSAGRCVASVLRHDQLGERVVLQLGEEVECRRGGPGSRTGRRSAAPRAASRTRS